MTRYPSWCETHSRELLEAGQSVSAAAAQELEATLDAAFADPQAAESLLRGRLSSGLRYSGLGFGSEQTATGLPTSTKGSASPVPAKSEAERVAAERNLETAAQEAALADAALEETRHALSNAAMELTRLKADEARAVRRSKASSRESVNSEDEAQQAALELDGCRAWRRRFKEAGELRRGPDELGPQSSDVHRRPRAQMRDSGLGRHVPSSMRLCRSSARRDRAVG